MPQKVDKIAINNEALDRRVKLTQSDKYEIVRLYGTGDYSQRKLANLYKVSRRTIQFIIDPNKHIENLKRRAEKGGSKQYYDREKQTQSIREHRKYKNELFKKRINLIFLFIKKINYIFVNTNYK